MEKNNTTVIIKQLRRTCDWGAAEQYRAHLTSPKSKLTGQKQWQLTSFYKIQLRFLMKNIVCLFVCFSSGSGHHGWFDHVNSLDDGIQNILVRTNVKNTIIPRTSIPIPDKNYIHWQFLAVWANQSDDTVNSMAMTIKEIDLHVPSFRWSIKCDVTNIHLIDRKIALLNVILCSRSKSLTY